MKIIIFLINGNLLDIGTFHLICNKLNSNSIFFPTSMYSHLKLPLVIEATCIHVRVSYIPRLVITSAVLKRSSFFLTGDTNEYVLKI